jgi:hypothetical protein
MDWIQKTTIDSWCRKVAERIPTNLMEIKMNTIKKVWNFLIELGEAIHEYKKGTKQYPKGWYY